MGEDETLVRLFLSAEGRVGRLAFLAASGALLILLTAFDFGAPEPVKAWAGWPVRGALAVSAGCLLSKRLHDRGRAGWWWPLPLLAFAVIWRRPWDGVRAAAWLVLVAALIELAVRPGAPGWSRFGPRPGSAASGPAAGSNAAP